MSGTTPQSSGSTVGPDPSAWAEAAAEIIEQLTLRWCLAGALAAIQYRRTTRATTDADLLVEWQNGLPQAFERAGYHVRTMADPGDHPHLVITKKEAARVDLIIPVVDYQHIALERGLPEHVLTVEDVIIHKLIAWRDKDRKDIRSILGAEHEIDVDYVERWAEFWGLPDRWQEATEGR